MLNIPCFLVITLMIDRMNAWCESTKFNDMGPVTCIDYSPDSTMIVTTTLTKVTIWDRVTKRILGTSTQTSAKCAMFSKDSPSTYIAITSNNCQVEILSAVSPFGSIQIFNSGHGGGAAVNMDFFGTTMLTCGGTNNKLKTWDLSVNPAVATFQATFSQSSYCALKSATEIGAASNNNLYLLSITSPTAFSTTMTKSINSCTTIAFSSTPNTMVAACNSGASDGVYIQTSSGTVSNIVTSGVMLTTSFALDGSAFCYGGNTNILYIVSSNKTIISQFVQTSSVLNTDFTDDGLYLAASTSDGTIYQYAKYCLPCKPGYYANLTTKTCVQCQTTMQGCAFCNSSTYCGQCYENYIYDSVNHLCLSCAGLIPNCGTCFNSSACRYCMSGYYLVTPGYTCSRCEAAMQGCYICNSSTICYMCESDFYLQSSNSTCMACQLAIVNCIKCTSNTYCTSCIIGYYQNSGNCLLCPTNCYICQSATNCTDCVTGYYAFSSGGSVTCTKCATGCTACDATGQCKNCADDRYLDATGSCLQCIYPCLTCNTSSFCLSCQVAYFFNGAGGCTECSNGCASCNSSTWCLSCSSSYYLDLVAYTCNSCQLLMSHCMQCTNTSCLKCQIGFYLFNSTYCGSCLVSMFACDVCSSATVCQFCSSGYYRTAGTGNSSCEICPLGCSTCISAANCTSCNVGYYLDTLASTCNICINNCIGCSSSSVCLECEIGYRLGAAGTCVACITDIPYCQSCTYNYSASALWCLSCQLGKYVDVATGGCLMCPQNCTACINSTACVTCQIGMYLDSTLKCLACSHNCSQCIGSASNCSSCVGGYYVTASFACQHCSAFGCVTCNSTTHNCLSCELGFYLKTVTGPPTRICDNCLSAISNCYVCISSTICKQCVYGYALTSNFLSCTPCSVIEGCKHCTALTSCQNCEVNYYLVVNGTGFGSCVRCALGCKECNPNGVCTTCFSQYILQNISGVISCSLCQLSMTGCLTCSNSTSCLSCLPGYYSHLGVCDLCSNPLFACKYCNSNTTCTSCQDGYYLSATNTCSKCQLVIAGCSICNSSSVCLSCEYGMYLNANLCYKCIDTLPNCLYCSSLSTCLQCDVGSYLSAGGCLSCEAHITGCIQCTSSSTCLQCKGGYFLNSTTHLCEPCKQEGCEVCVQSNPLQCVKCNARFYYNSTLATCVKCRNDISGCLECTSSTICSKCDPGYFVGNVSSCVLCDSVLSGCSKCSSASVCLECKSTFYIYSDNSCRDCKLAMPGCSHCINGSACQSCYHGYFLNTSSLCQTCTSITGCLSCISSTHCQYCETSYFLGSDNICYPCSVLEGCYACTNNVTCSICGGGYILNKDELVCNAMRVESHETITSLKLITRFVNNSCLMHYLYAKDMTYTTSDSINWNKTTKLLLQNSAYKQTRLQILKVEWENEYTLIFYTDNPLQLGQSDFQFTRRVLVSGTLSNNKYKINLQMDQTTINQILPQFYLPKDLIMGYNIGAPQFVMSYANANPILIYYSIFGYALIGVLTLKYFIKAACTVPGSAEMGDIIPQVMALKAPAFFIYPSYMEFVYYCAGFMVADLPWLNQFFGKIMSDPSDAMPDAFALFFINMNIGSTYFLAFIIIIVIIFILWLFYKSKQESDYKEKFPLGRFALNFFIFGATWATCASFQGGLINPIQTVNVNSGLYMAGIAFYFIIFAICLYDLYKSRKNMYLMRIFIKASLLAIANISPIYIFCSSVLIDLILIAIEYYFGTVNRMYPKVWVAKNILLDLALCVLTFMPSLLLTLIFASFLATVALLLDIFTHLKEYKQAARNKKFVPNNQSELDVNIWNVNFQKQNIDKGYKLEEFGGEPEPQPQLEQEQDKIQDDARRTGFVKTAGSTATKNYYKRRERKPKANDQVPQVIDPQDPAQINASKQNEFQQENKNEFIAQTYLS